MTREIIDFHTHPWGRAEHNICHYAERMEGDPAAVFHRDLTRCGITRAAGMPICRGLDATPEGRLTAMRMSNADALATAEALGDFYIPGMAVHPEFVRESCEEMERMHAAGVRLIGELVPYCCGWGDDPFLHPGLFEILSLAEELSMVVSFHSMAARADEYEMMKRHPGVTFVGAHPGEKEGYLRHLSRIEELPNYYLDLSGTGLFRYGMLAYGVRRVGAERLLFGSDYPICSPGMNIGAVDYEEITDRERALILSGNAKRLLGL